MMAFDKKAYNRENTWRWRHGITRTQRNQMILEQDGKCAICSQVFGDDKSLNKPYIDHCHQTGNVRKILCLQCNTALGKLKDSPALLRAAADYIELHRVP
jgi:Recombination endonuclease VII